MSLDDTQMHEFLMLARKVRTQAGATQFDQPIGSDISDSPARDTAGQSITPTRLRSLHRLYVAARKAGDTALTKKTQEEFQAAFRIFAAKHSTAEALLAVEEPDSDKKKT